MFSRNIKSTYGNLSVSAFVLLFNFNQWLKAGYEIMCRAASWNVSFHSRWNEINPPTPEGISRSEATFHERSSFHKSPAKKIPSQSRWIFLSNPQDWYGINVPCALYGIATKSRMASRVSVHFSADWFHTSLRDDSIQTLGLIPYRNELRITYTPFGVMKMRTSVALYIKTSTRLGAKWLTLDEKIWYNKLTDK